MKARRLPQSISCGKTFRGHTALKSFQVLHKWLLELGNELEERIAADRVDNERIPRLLTVFSGISPIHFAQSSQLS